MKIDYERLREERNEKNQFAKNNGIRITKVSKGYAVAEMDVDSKKKNPIGTVHGGCLFTMADTCAGAAASSHGHWVTTVNAQVNYLNAARDSKHITAESSEIKVGKSLIVEDVNLHDETGRHLVHATFTFYVLDGTYDYVIE
jgi:acyl-CoA thioesterase